MYAAHLLSHIACCLSYINHHIAIAHIIGQDGGIWAGVDRESFTGDVALAGPSTAMGLQGPCHEHGSCHEHRRCNM